MKIVTAETIVDLLARAAAAPRRRMNLNLHTEMSDPIGRFLNGGLPGTYVRPHRHRIGRWELVNVLEGALDVLIFDSVGKIEERLTLGNGRAGLIEISGGDWHSFFFRPPAAVVLEVKPGPYEPQLDKEFAEWAPVEGDPAVASFITWLESAALGDMWRG
jgi:cupin fold WbuC family metalloprotein